MKIIDFKSKNFEKELCKITDAKEGSSQIAEIVSKVIADIKLNGDTALLEYTKKFDKAELTPKTLAVSKSEIARALKETSAEEKAQIKEAIKCVSFFHKKTMPKNWRARNPQGAIVGENFYPINRVGLYIPGGQVPLVSTVVMTGVLAKIAKCPEICVCTPPSPEGKINSKLLCALNFLGISEIYKCGGSQAIAAMALGTKTIKPVDKLFGPGNAFVIEAKRQMFGKVGVDLLPGPSEVLILSDSTASAKYVAADLLSQAEHGSGRERIFYVSTSEALLKKVLKEIEIQAQTLSRREKLKAIIENSTYVIHCPDIKSAAYVANRIAPEHMELQVAAKDLPYLEKNIKTAGAILAGEYTPTVLGDFTAGPSHTLPTGGTGRFSGGLQLIDFMRRSSFVKYDKKSIAKAAPVVAAFSKMEMLDAHGASLLKRL